MFYSRWQQKSFHIDFVALSLPSHLPERVLLVHPTPASGQRWPERMFCKLCISDRTKLAERNHFKVLWRRLWSSLGFLVDCSTSIFGRVTCTNPSVQPLRLGTCGHRFNIHVRRANRDVRQRSFLKGQYHRKKNQCMELIFFFTSISYFSESEKT